MQEGLLWSCIPGGLIWTKFFIKLGQWTVTDTRYYEPGSLAITNVMVLPRTRAGVQLGGLLSQEEYKKSTRRVQEEHTKEALSAARHRDVIVMVAPEAHVDRVR